MTRLSSSPRNCAVMTANVLGRSREFQKAADHLPRGTVLLIVPSHDCRMTQSMRLVAAAFRSRGRSVGVIRLDASS